MTYKETIENVLLKMKQFQDWSLVGTMIRRLSECPITCGEGVDADGAKYTALRLGYDRQATYDIIRAADHEVPSGESLGHLRTRMLAAANHGAPGA